MKTETNPKQPQCRACGMPHLRGQDVPAETVKRVDLFGNVTDTYATETELNGFRLTQGKML